MPGISRLLNDKEADQLKDLAQSWGLDLPGDPGDLKSLLRNTMSDPKAIKEILETLAEPASRAMNRLATAKGKIPWASFAREFGDIRPMGPGRREREQPAHHPQSIAEILWYRGLISRAFFDEKPEAREYAYIPDEILAQMTFIRQTVDLPPGRPAAHKEYTSAIQVNTAVLDQTCTLLSALRMSRPFEAENTSAIPIKFLTDIMTEAGLLDVQNKPVVEPVRKFLEALPGEALLLLAKTWLNSTRLNDFFDSPGLIVEGNPDNHPAETRDTIINHLRRVPAGKWWSLQSFIQYFHDQNPDFQRPAGDFDSWFIRSQQTGEYLRGFENWNSVEGAFLRFLVTGPLHWLGFVDLASSSPSRPPDAFRLSAWSKDLLNSTAPQLPAEEAKISVRSTGRISVPENAPRAARYIIARFCEWGSSNQKDHVFQISAKSLKAAYEQGLRISHLFHVLEANCSAPIPPILIKTMERWEKAGIQAELQYVVILKVAHAEILTALKHSKAGRFLGAELNPTTIEVKKGFERQVEQALFEIGYLVDLKPDV